MCVAAGPVQNCSFVVQSVVRGHVQCVWRPEVWCTDGRADEREAEDEAFVARVAAALGSLGQMQAGVPFDWMAAVSRAENEAASWVMVSVVNSERSCAVVLFLGATAAKVVSFFM